MTIIIQYASNKIKRYSHTVIGILVSVPVGCRFLFDIPTIIIMSVNSFPFLHRSELSNAEMKVLDIVPLGCCNDTNESEP